MTVSATSPQPRLVTSEGGWSFALAFTNQAGYPIDLTQSGMTVKAEFSQLNPPRTTGCAVTLTNGVAGAAVALVAADVVLSTLNPMSSAAFISGVQVGAPPPNPFRLIAYLVDSLGMKVEGSEQIFPVLPLDPRTTDLTQIPAAQTLQIVVGPAGATGAQGGQGQKGDPGGLAPYFGKSATTISDGQPLILTSAGLLLASSDQPGQAGSVVGIADGGSVAGQQQAYLDTGSYTNTGWTWTAGLPVFVGLNGTLTQTSPTSGFVQQVGTALSATSIKLSLGLPTIIDA